MENKKILYISQEITPFMPETKMSVISRFLPQGIQESGKEVRVFMPRFGTVNERRNQLHEVIRLSGMNLIIDDTDHSLIIKVTSIQQARMQVYFIDNDEYFKRKFIFEDEDGNFFEDNDERMIFFNRGAVETTKKLRWTPDIIHCHGWFSALVPVFIKKSYHNDPLFKNAKIVYSVYDDDFKNELNPSLRKKLDYYGIKASDVKQLKNPDYLNIQKTAVDYSDAIILGSDNINEELLDYIKKSGKDILTQKNEDEYISEYNNFYDSILKN